MTPHFGTYHWSKNTAHGCQNTVQGCKIAFDTPFLATPIGVALSHRCRVGLLYERVKEMDGREKKPTLRSHLIQSCGEDDGERSGGRVFERDKVVEEVKKQLWLSGPLISVSLLQFCLQVIC